MGHAVSKWWIPDWRKKRIFKVFDRDEDPDPVLFSTDPDPTCNNGFIKLFLSWTKYKSESTKSKHKMMGYNIEFYPYIPKI